jgi:hypothetical protein
MKKNVVLAMLIFAAAFTSCKKENDIVKNETPVPVAPNERFLLSSSDTYNSYTFEYNADKTLKKYTVNGGYWEFTYQPNKVIETYYFNNIKRGYVVNELLNGIAQKQTTIYYDVNGAVSNTYTDTYTYNTKGLLSKEEFTQDGNYAGTANWTYDNNDDLINYFATDKNGATISNSNYEYDLNLPEKSGSFGQFNSSATGSMFPKKSKHLVKKQTVVSSNEHYFFTYTLDASGYVLSSIMKDDASVVVGTTTNTWQ